jgi:hypothetical protein
MLVVEFSVIPLGIGNAGDGGGKIINDPLL